MTQDPALHPIPPTVVTPLASAAPRRRTMDASWLVLGLAAAIAIGGVAFAAGRATAPAAATTSGPGAGVFPGGMPGASLAPGASFEPNASFAPGAGGPGGAGAITLSGTVTAVSGTTMTITTGDGRTIDLDVSGATWHQQASATASDVTAGTSVQVTVSGGMGGRPGTAPAASGAPATSSVTATDVTILGR